MSKHIYTVGDLAKRCGLTARRVRFYADAGLLPPAARGENGYRQFGPEDIARLSLIGMLRRMGLPLRTIRTALEETSDLRAALARQLAELERDIADKNRVAVALRALLASSSVSLTQLERSLAMPDNAETQRAALIVRFFESVTAGVAHDTKWREAMVTTATPHWAHTPTRAQLEAWNALDALLADPDFAAAMRAQAIDTGRTLAHLKVRDDRAAWQLRHDALMREAETASSAGHATDSLEGQRLADAYVAFMAWNRDLANDQAFAAYLWVQWAHIAKVARFWSLIAAISGEPTQNDPAYTWLEAATFARLGQRVSAAVSSGSRVKMSPTRP